MVSGLLVVERDPFDGRSQSVMGTHAAVVAEGAVEWRTRGHPAPGWFRLDGVQSDSRSFRLLGPTLSPLRFVAPEYTASSPFEP